MHPSSIRGGHKYSKSGPKPAGASSCLSAKTAQCLIALPLVLALFALSLQVSLHQHLAVCLHSREDASRSVCCAVDHPRQNRSKAASVHARGLRHQVCQPIFSMSCTMQPYSEDLYKLYCMCCSDRLQYAQLPGSTRKELRELSDSNSGSKPQQSAGQQSGLEWRPAGTDLKGQKVC